MNKKNLFYPLLILIFLIPVTWPLFKGGFFAAHDAVWHIARFYQFHLSFSSGQIPVRWAPSLFYGLGYPAFIVNFHLPYYLMEAIYIFGVSLVNTYKIFLGLTFVASAIFSFLFLRSFFGYLPALAGTIFFVYSPYRFATVYTRGAIGEALAIALVPLVFWSIKLLADNEKFGGPLLALAIFLLIISHPNIFLIFFPVIFFTLLFFTIRSKQNLVPPALWLCLGVFASAFQTLPFFFERHFLIFDAVYKEVYLGHFVNLASALRLPLVNADLGTPFQIGIFHWIIVIFALILTVFDKGKLNQKRFLAGTTGLFFLIGLFLMSEWSVWFWKNFPLLPTILFPWRFLNLLVFSSSVAAAYVISRFKNLLLGLLFIILAIFPSRHFWGWVGQIPTEASYYQNYEGTTTAGGEFTPWGISAEIERYKDPKIEIISGEGKIISQKISNNHWQFETMTRDNSVIKLALLNFAGWNVKVDGLRKEIIGNYKTGDNNYSGLIVFKVPPGLHKINVTFGETRLRFFSDIITALALFSIFASLMLRSRLFWNKIGQCKK